MQYVTKCFTFLIMSLILSSAAYAQTTVVVDLPRILEQSAAAKHARAQIKTLGDAFLVEFNKKEKELKAADKHLLDQRSVLSAENYEVKLKELRTKQADTQRQLQLKRNEIDKTLNQAISTIYKNVNLILKQLSEEKKFDVALNVQQILYIKPEMNITDEVLKRLDKQLPKLPLTIKKQ